MFRFFHSENSNLNGSPLIGGALGSRYQALGRLRVFRFGFLLVALFMLFFSGILTNVEGLSNRKEMASTLVDDQLLSARVAQKSLNPPVVVRKSLNPPGSVLESGN